jgi:hypothetical protein
MSPDLLLSLSPAVLSALVTTFHRPSSSSPALPTAHALLVRALFTRVPSKRLAAALARIAPFCTRAGRLALLEAAHACALPTTFINRLFTLPYPDVAATLLLELERTTSPARRRTLRRLFALASLRVARDLPERPTYELVADAAPVSLDPARVLTLLRAALGARLVDAWDARDADGTLRVALFLEQPGESFLPRPGRNKPITPRAETLIAADVVRVFPDGARVGLTLAQPHLLPVYASALSLSLRPSLTLRPFQTLAPTALAHLARATRGFTAFDVVGARRRGSSERRVETRGPGSLEAPEQGARTGYLDRATFRGTADDATDVDAFLQLPHRVEISDRAREPAFRGAMDTLGIFSPGALPDDARSLAGGEHGDWRWRAVFGDDGTFERLCKTKRFVRTQSKHVATREHRMHGAGYVVRDVPGEPGLEYALAEDRALGARLVGPKDRVAWRLDEGALTAAMMRDLGARAAPSPLSGVLDLGIVTLPSGKLRIVYAMAEPPAGWVEALRRAAGMGMTPVVLVPKGHAGEAKGMLEIELSLREQLGAVPLGRALGRTAEALDLAAEVDPPKLYDEEVIVETATERTWVVGVPIAFNEHRWKFMHFLARRGGAVSAAKDIGASISKSAYPDVVARRIKAQIERQVRAELRAAGVDAGVADRLIVGEGRLGYRFGVGVRVL